MHIYATTHTHIHSIGCILWEHPNWYNFPTDMLTGQPSVDNLPLRLSSVLSCVRLTTKARHHIMYLVSFASKHIMFELTLAFYFLSPRPFFHVLEYKPILKLQNFFQKSSLLTAGVLWFKTIYILAKVISQSNSLTLKEKNQGFRRNIQIKTNPKMHKGKYQILQLSIYYLRLIFRASLALGSCTSLVKPPATHTVFLLGLGRLHYVSQATFGRHSLGISKIPVSSLNMRLHMCRFMQWSLMVSSWWLQPC